MLFDTYCNLRSGEMTVMLAEPATYSKTDIVSAKRAIRPYLFDCGRRDSFPLIHAVGTSTKLVHGVDTGCPCVTFHVLEKCSRSKLSREEILPSDIQGIPTDVVQSRQTYFSSSMVDDARSATFERSLRRRQTQRPVCGGISAAHRHVNSGTIACFCRSTSPTAALSTVYVLSNNHTFAMFNEAKIGDPLYQSAPIDGGTSREHFANLSRYVPIHYGSGAWNRVDAAIGKLIRDVEFSSEVCSIGRILGKTRAHEGMKVAKHGRNTGYTEGVVTSNSYDACVGLDYRNPRKVAFFEEQIRIEPSGPCRCFAQGGDSGSLIVDRSSNKAIGLYFAGAQDGSYGLASHIEDVAQDLEIELI